MLAPGTILNGTSTLRPRVLAGPDAAPLPTVADARIVRVLVDLQTSTPGMVEITFLDPDGDTLTEAGLTLGTPLEVWGPTADDTSACRLVTGEVTALEGEYSGLTALLVVRGYTAEHRLQRVRRSRTFTDQTDSDIALAVARTAGLTAGQVDRTSTVLPYVSQANQSDWDFLAGRARAIGYEFGVHDGAFHFRRAGTAATATTHPLAFRRDLRRFQPRVSSGNLAPEVEVRVWDPVRATAVAARAPTRAPGVDLTGGGPAGGDAQRAADQALGPHGPRPAPAPSAGGDVGPAPSDRAFVVVDRPQPVGRNDAAAGTLAASTAARLGAGYAEADGEALGDARIVAGCAVEVTGVAAAFAGTWLVTRARHVFDGSDDGYRTHFSASGGQDRSVSALTVGAAHPAAPVVACGVVTNVRDPEGLGRVTVLLPWLSPEYQSDWAPVCQLFAGERAGAMFLPQPGDQVVVGFEFGDLTRPYVLGSLPSTRTAYGVDGRQGGAATPGASALRTSGETSTVVRRGLVTPAGSALVFHDELPPGGGRPTAAQLAVTTGGGMLGLVLDQVAGTVTLRCGPDAPGKLVVEATGSSAVEIKAGPGGSLTIDGGAHLTLRGKTIDISGTGPVSVGGKPIRLN